MSGQPGILKKMNAITSEIGSVGKTNTNSFQNYRFRSIAQAMAALQPLLVKHKVVVQPSFQNVQIIEQEKGAGATVNLALGFWDTEDGSSLVVHAVGQGSDAGDKAVPKAMACAMKYAIFSTFMVPEDGIDAEFSSPEVKPKSKATPVRNIGG